MCSLKKMLFWAIIEVHNKHVYCYIVYSKNNFLFRVSLTLYFLQQLNIVGKLKSNSLLPQVPQYGHHLLKKVFVLFSWDCNTLCFAFHSFLLLLKKKTTNCFIYQWLVELNLQNISHNRTRNIAFSQKNLHIHNIV